MLCHDAVIQNTPVSAVALTQEQNEACEAAGMNRWIGGPTSNSCSRRYGITSVKVTYLGKPKYFNTQQVDLTRKSELEAQINELKYQLEEVKKDMATRNAVRNEIGALTKELSTELDAIKEEKNTAQIAISKYNTARGKLSAAEDRLRDLIQSGEHFNDTMKQLESGLEKLALKRAQAAIDYIVGYPLHKDYFMALTAAIETRRGTRGPQQQFCPAQTALR